MHKLQTVLPGGVILALRRHSLLFVNQLPFGFFVEETFMNEVSKKEVFLAKLLSDDGKLVQYVSREYEETGKSEVLISSADFVNFPVNNHFAEPRDQLVNRHNLI